MSVVQFVEIPPQHQHFATYLQQRWPVLLRQSKRDGADGFEILGDAFADRTIAACGALLKNAIDIGQADCEPVKFGFAGVLDLGITKIQAFAAAPIKVFDVPITEGIT